MITVVATYKGRCLSELELAGLTSNPATVAKVIGLLRDEEPHLVQKSPAFTRRRGSLRVVHDGSDVS